MKKKLIEILDAGEGHTIFKTDFVIKALKEYGFAVEKTKNMLIISKEGKTSKFYLTKNPVHLSKSKYDIAMWENNDPDGIWDLDLIFALVESSNKKYNGATFIGRGFRYRAYRDWLRENKF